jgi:hypothetical protein
MLRAMHGNFLETGSTAKSNRVDQPVNDSQGSCHVESVAMAPAHGSRAPAWPDAGDNS